MDNRRAASVMNPAFDPIPEMFDPPAGDRADGLLDLLNVQEVASFLVFR